MLPPLMQVLAASSAVEQIFGDDAARVYANEAPPEVDRPYAVFSTIYGTPENELGDSPGVDSWGVQIDVYGARISEVRDGAQAIRDAIEPHAYVVSWRGEGRDKVTRDHSFSFDIEWLYRRT